MIVVAAVVVAGGTGRSQGARQEWPVYGGDAGATRYSPLTDINRRNVGALQIAWTWKPGERALAGVRHAAGHVSEHAADDRRRAVCQHAVQPRRGARRDAPAGSCGATIPSRSRMDSRRTAPASCTAASPRGETSRAASHLPQQPLPPDLSGRASPARWSRRSATRACVDLTEGLSWKVNPRHYTNTSPPVVYRNLVILGNGVGDRLTYRNDPPGDVRAFDARTGKIVWTFRPVPRAGEPGNETWGEGSWQFTGHTNVWAPMSLDAGARAAVPAGQHAEQRLLRRAPSRRQSLCRVDRLPRCGNRSAQVALPDRASRPVGLRPGGRAGPHVDHRRRPARSMRSCS